MTMMNSFTLKISDYKILVWIEELFNCPFLYLDEQRQKEAFNSELLDKELRIYLKKKVHILKFTLIKCSFERSW